MYRCFLTATLAMLVVAGCGGPDPSAETEVDMDSDGFLEATVRIADGDATRFSADEVVASLGSSVTERELVIFARSIDLSETLAFVIDLNKANVPGVVDLSAHGALYLEPGFGLGGADLIFDAEPQGRIELEGETEPGGTINGRFFVTVQGYDTARPQEGLYVSLEGTFVLPVESLLP